MSELDDAFARANRAVECMQMKTRALTLKNIVIGGGVLTPEQQDELSDLEIKLRDCDARS
jgi:hypothetical protein